MSYLSYNALMAITQRQGRGGPRFNDDLVNAAMLFAGVLLIIFFLLVARLYLDKKEGKDVVLKPERSPAKVIQSLMHRND